MMKIVVEQFLNDDNGRELFELAIFSQKEIAQNIPRWIEVQPVRVAVDRVTGRRIFLDPTDGIWHPLLEKE